MADCIFCKIVKGEVKAHTVYENESVLAFLDIHPASRGHTMVIPKVHAERLDLLEDRHVVPADVEPAGQHVNHLHVHLIPRYAGDGGGGVQSLIRSSVKEDLASVAGQIRSAAK